MDEEIILVVLFGAKSYVCDDMIADVDDSLNGNLELPSCTAGYIWQHNDGRAAAWLMNAALRSAPAPC